MPRVEYFFGAGVILAEPSAGSYPATRPGIIIPIAHSLQLRALHHHQIAWVSCTDEPSWAAECLEKFKTKSGRPIGSTAASSQIYKANKQTHFKKLSAELGVPLDQMVFFDNERGNITSVAKIGVHSVYCPDGMTRQIWDEGMRGFASKSA